MCNTAKLKIRVCGYFFGLSWWMFTDVKSTKNCSLEVGHSKEPENVNL